MASPQIEDGYTVIANEILDALCVSTVGGSEYQVLMTIIRKTYGWNKKSDYISYSQLVEITGLARRTVIYAVRNLEVKNMIIVERSKTDLLNNVNLISFQKDHDTWVVQEIDGSARKCPSYRATIEKQKENYKNRGGSARNCSSARFRQGVVQEFAPTKDNITKYNNTCVQKRKNTHSGDFEHFYLEYPKKVGKEPAWRAWQKLNSDLPPLDELIKIVRAMKETPNWKKDNGQFIPHPATWLNQKRWLDEIEVKNNSAW